MPRRRPLRAFLLLATGAIALGLQWPVSPAVAQAPALVPVNPDDSGPMPGCPAPCPAGGSGGRVHRLASSPARPQDIYAASELGGLFKSRNGGATWGHLDGFLPTKAWDVAVDPAGTTIYATSFFDGRVDSLAGISVSPDAGATWQRPVTATPPAGFCDTQRRRLPSAFGIAVRPGNPAEVLIGTNCGLARSGDAGATWTFIDPTPADGGAQSVWDVAALPGGLTYACGQDGVVRSANGISGWSKLPDAVAGGVVYDGYCDMAVDPAYPEVVFVVFSRITYFDPIFDVRETAFFASLDGGQNWTVMPHPDGTLQKRVPMVATNPRANGIDVWVGAGNLFRIPCVPFGIAAGCQVTSTAAWQGTYTDASGDVTKGHGDMGDVLFAQDTAQDACPRMFATDGGIYVNRRTQSPACHDPDMASANVGLHAQLLLGMAGVHVPGAAGEHVYMPTQDVGMFSTLDAGARNPSWFHAVGGDMFDVVADEVQSVAYDGGALRLGGQGYTNPVAVPTPAPPAKDFYTVFTDVVDQTGPSTYVLAVGTPASADVLVTRNLSASSLAAGAVTWSSLGWPAAAGFPCGLQASRAPVSRGGGRRSGPDSRIYVLSGDCRWRSTNQLWALTPGTGSWTRIDVNSECPGGVGIIGADPVRPRRVYASCTGASPPTMIRSLDAGASWTTDASLTELMTGSGVFLPSYGDPGDGATRGGVQPVMVAFDPHDENLILAGAYDAGLFLSSDGGGAWAPLFGVGRGSLAGPPLPRPFYAHFDHDGGGRGAAASPLRSIYIGTVGRGIWRITPRRVDVRIQINTSLVLPSVPERPPQPCDECPLDPDLEVRYLIDVAAVAGNAANPVLRFVLPDDLELVGVEAPRGWNCAVPARGASGVIRCVAGNLTPGQQARFAVRARATPRGRTRALVEASIAAAGVDPRADDNRAVVVHVRR